MPIPTDNLPARRAGEDPGADSTGQPPSQARAGSEAVLAATAHGIYGLDPEGRVLFVNSAAERLTGIPSGKVLGQLHHEAVGHTRPDGRRYDPAECPVAMALADGKAREVAGDLFFRPDGTSFPVEYFVSPVHDRQGMAGAVLSFSDLSRRKTAEEELRRSEERFRSLVLALSQLVWVTDSDGRALGDSASWRAYTGQTLEEAEGFGWLEALHPDDRERTAHAWAEAVHRKAIFESEYRLRRHDGVYRWFFARGAPVLESDGRVREWVGACIDVDDRRRQAAEREQLVEQHARERRKLAAILDRIPVGVLIVEPPLGRVTLMNRALFRLTGAACKPETIADLEAFGGRRSDGSRLLVSDLPISRALVFGEETKEQQMQLDGPDSVVVSVNALPLLDDEGRIEAAACTMVDVTARRQEEERQKLLEGVTRMLASCLDRKAMLERALALVVPAFVEVAAVGTLDARGQLADQVINAVEPAFEGPARALLGVLGLTQDAQAPLLRMLWAGTPLVVGRVLPGSLAALAPKESGEVAGEDSVGALAVLPLTARDKRLGLLFLARRRGRTLSRGDHAFAQELARRIANALDSANLYAAAREAVRARDELLSIASHDLKLPLTSLRMHAQLVQRHLKTGKDPAALLESTHARMELMDKQLVRLTAMLDELLDVSRLQAGRLELHLEPVDFSQLVREAAERLDPDFERSGSSVSLQLEEGVEGRWDRLRLDQVVSNLLANAAKYGRGQPVAVRLSTENGVAHLAVADLGIGIAPEDMTRIFEPFERARERHRTVPGTGLGLWIARRVVEGLGGRIEVESTLKVGSTFHVWLPVAAGENSGVQERQRPAPGPQPGV